MAHTLLHPNTDWQSIEITSTNHNTLEVHSLEFGIVQIESCDQSETHYHRLTQDDIKALITHLQKQLK